MSWPSYAPIAGPPTPGASLVPGAVGGPGAPFLGGGSQAGMGGMGLLKSFGDILEGFQQSRNYGSQQQAAFRNAAFDTAAGKTAFMTAADRGAAGLRTGAEEVGRQAAAIGESGSGIATASSQNVVRQSEKNQRMDFLNTIYGGQVQKYNYDEQSQEQEYMAKVAGLNKQNAMYGGFMNAGTDALTSVAKMGL
jgi:hypothetical protein